MFRFFLISILLISLLFDKAEAQIDFNKDYTPLSRNSPPKSELELIHIIHQNSPLLKVEKYQKEFKELNSDLQKLYEDNLDSSNYYFDDLVYPYIQKIFQTVVKSNPELKNLHLNLLVSRSPIPNAFARPDGYMEFNIGMLRYVEDESQIACIIGHELAHVYLSHSIKSHTNYLDHAKSKETKQQIKEILNSEFNRNTKATNFFKDLGYNMFSHSRNYELESDSLGIYFLSKTPYSIDKGSKMLLVLGNLDKEKYIDTLRLDQIFNSENYPFKSRWIKESSFIRSRDTLTQSFIDSFKSHPDSDLRYENAVKLNKKLQQTSGKQFIQDSSLFYKIRNTADFECVENMFNEDEVSLSIYLTLKLLHIYPDNLYLKKKLIGNLEKIKKGLDEMKLSHYIALPNPFSTNDYNQLVLFLNSIRYSEIETLITEMSKKYSIH